jgi:formylglycine-generating enzyme required for sulfatase activity
MKKIAFIIIIISIFSLNQSLFLNASNNNPPGTIQFEESLYVDITEVTNIAYREYLFWLNKNFGANSEQYINALPDTCVWGDNKPFMELYLRHPSYKDYPLVGISYEQAINYCDWRSERVNEVYFIKENKINYENISEHNIPQIYSYRLPTKEEWEYIARIDFSDKTKKQQSKKKNQNQNLYNVKDTTIKEDKIVSITAPAKSYWPNEIGVYNTTGNVAEMIQEKGIAKGGSWIHSIDEIKIEKDFKYEQAENWLGFRCVCEKNKINK